VLSVRNTVDESEMDNSSNENKLARKTPKMMNKTHIPNCEPSAIRVSMDGWESCSNT
jgi:hypothetical protein